MVALQLLFGDAQLSLTCFFLIQLFPAPYSFYSLVHCPFMFHEVKERKLCPQPWEKEEVCTNLTPRVYLPRGAVFIHVHSKGMMEFVGENTNTGKNIAELPFTITDYHYQICLSLSQTQSI